MRPIWTYRPVNVRLFSDTPSNLSADQSGMKIDSWRLEDVEARLHYVWSSILESGVAPLRGVQWMYILGCTTGL